MSLRLRAYSSRPAGVSASSSDAPPSNGFPQFRRFVAAVHRRYVAIRLIERAGVGLLGGSAAALILLPVLLWTDKPALGIVIATIGFSAGVGILWGILRRPTRLESAMEADRQLELADLLGTALSIDECARVRAHAAGGRPFGPAANHSRQFDDPWECAVVAIAESRCLHVKPRSVLLNRLGARAWGGIGLSASAVVALAMFFGVSVDNRAAANRTHDSKVNREVQNLQTDEMDKPLIAAAPSALPPAPEHDDPDGGPSVGRPSPGRSANEQNSSAQHDNAPSPGDKGTTSGGTGRGSSQTDKPLTAPAPTRSADVPKENHGGDTRPAAGQNVTAGGSGPSDASADAGTTGIGRAGKTAAANADRHVTPPWKSDSWPADVQRAQDALNSGRVPAAYEEMVRGYFQRE